MRSRISYPNFVLALLTGHVADIATTEIILHHSARLGSEANAIVADLHEGRGVWLFRGAIVGAVTLALILCRPTPQETLLAARTGLRRFVFARRTAMPRRLTVKLNVILCLAIFSVSRLIAGASNVSGELAGVSLPIFFDRHLGIVSEASIHLASTLTSLIVSTIIVAAIWPMLFTAPVATRPVDPVPV